MRKSSLPTGLAATLFCAATTLAQATDPFASELDPAGRLDTATHTALKRDKRVLIIWGTRGDADSTALVTAIHGMKVRDQRSRYEFEVVALDAKAEGAMQAKLLGADVHRLPQATVLDAAGKLLVHADTASWLSDGAVDGEAVQAFAELWKVPMPDARDVLAAGLAQAKRTNKSVLVHLAAPW